MSSFIIDKESNVIVGDTLKTKDFYEDVNSFVRKNHEEANKLSIKITELTNKFAKGLRKLNIHESHIKKLVSVQGLKMVNNSNFSYDFNKLVPLNIDNNQHLRLDNYPTNEELVLILSCYGYYPLTNEYFVEKQLSKLYHDALCEASMEE